MIRFEWDAKKAESNRRKHGKTFEEAETVFEDPYVLSWKDRIIQGEQRWQTMGYSSYQNLLFIAHTTTIENDEDEIIRIISARTAEPHERRVYENRKR